MLFSIIIPAYNAEKFISRTIDSVLNQKFNDYEVIIINDGSLDNTKTVIQKHANPKIKILTISNHGVSYCRNLGINLAMGKYILFLDADDYLPSNILFNLKVKLNSLNYSPDIIFGNYVRFNEKNKSTRNIIFDYKSNLSDCNGIDIWKSLYNRLDQFSMPIMAQVYRKDFIKENNLYFDTNLFIAEDLDWRYSLFLKSQKYYNADEIMYYYFEDNSSSVTNSKYSYKKYQNNIRMLIKWYEITKKINIEKEILDIITTIISENYANIATKIHYIKDKQDYKKAIKLFKQESSILNNVKSLKYKIAKIIFKLFGAKVYVYVFAKYHEFKCKISHQNVF